MDDTQVVEHTMAVTPACGPVPLNRRGIKRRPAADSGSLHQCKCETGLGIAWGQALRELRSAIKRVKQRERVVSPFTDATRRISVLQNFLQSVCCSYKCYMHCGVTYCKTARVEHVYRHPVVTEAKGNICVSK